MCRCLPAVPSSSRLCPLLAGLARFGPERPGVFERLFRHLRAEVLSAGCAIFSHSGPTRIELSKKLRRLLIGLVLGAAVVGFLPAGDSASAPLRSPTRFARAFGTTLHTNLPLWGNTKILRLRRCPLAKVFHFPVVSAPSIAFLRAQSRGLLTASRRGNGGNRDSKFTARRVSRPAAITNSLINTRWVGRPTALRSGTKTAG